VFFVTAVYTVETVDSWEDLDRLLREKADAAPHYSDSTTSRAGGAPTRTTRVHVWRVATFDVATKMRKRLATIKGIAAVLREE
jgi:hypothetical protein